MMNLMKKLTVFMLAFACAMSLGMQNASAATNKNVKFVTKTNKFNVSELRLTPKKSFKLKVKGNKNKLTWASGYKKVATVNSKGKVTAKEKWESHHYGDGQEEKDCL